MTFPDGGETWDTDTALVIYWDLNVLDTVNIELYKNEIFYKTIVDSFYSETGGYSWKLPDSLQSGSDYKIKISSIDGSLEDMSESNFTIIYTTSDVKRINGLVTDFKLEQNYPNPFNPSTNIQFNIPNREFVLLKIYDVLGNEIMTLINEEKLAGGYNVEFDASNLPSGVYFYTLTAGSFNQTRKMLLLK
ncbi:MAG: T9SS type A sorting domain-containing protein [Ignavibacteriaceae bacterium]